MTTQALSALWSFITANIVAVLGTFFAALLGASASQIISGRAKTKELYRNQVRDTNTALALSLYIAEKLLSFKLHNVRDMMEVYEKQKAAYHKSVSTGVEAQLGPIDLEEHEVLQLPATELRTNAYEKLFLTLPLQAAAAELVEMLGLLNKSIERRHVILRQMLERGPNIDEAMKRILFAASDNNGNVDARYSSSMEGIWHYLNWSIHHAMFLSERLPAHGRFLGGPIEKSGSLESCPKCTRPTSKRPMSLGWYPLARNSLRGRRSLRRESQKCRLFSAVVNGCAHD